MTMVKEKAFIEPATSFSADQMAILEQLSKPEVRESITVLLEHLPKLTEMAVQMTKTYDLVQTLASDRVLINDLKGGLEEMAKPVVEKAKNIASAAIEANDRAQNQTETIGLFGLMRMLKDPQAQKLFRFTRSFMDIMAERRQGEFN